MKQSAAIPYRRISLFFVLILLVLTWGFYKTYIIFFPSFTGFTFIQHFHGAMMLLWMLMLIVQPLLIYAGKIKIHHFIGKASFVMAPLVVISIFLMARMVYLRPEPPAPHNEKIGGIALPIPSMVVFALFYCLAIANRRRTYYHMRYMIGTGLLMIGPGLGRALIVYYHVPFAESVSIIWYVAMAIAFVLFMNDILRKRSYAANAIVLAGVALCFLAWEFRLSTPWQGVGELIARNLF